MASFSIVPWVANIKYRFKMPTIVNQKLMRRARSKSRVTNTRTYPPPVQFRPYVSKVPWHSGVRGQVGSMKVLLYSISIPLIVWITAAIAMIWVMTPMIRQRCLRLISLLECLQKPHGDLGRPVHCESLQDDVHPWSDKHTYTIQNASPEASIWTTCDSIWMAEQQGKDGMLRKIQRQTDHAFVHDYG